MPTATLAVSCINGRAAKEFNQWLQAEGNTTCYARSFMVYIPAVDEEYASKVLNGAFERQWITPSQFAHAMTNFQNALRDKP